MEIYYWETEKSYGEESFENDEKAVSVLKERYGNELLVIYKESDTENGMPFIFVYEA